MNNTYFTNHMRYGWKLKTFFNLVANIPRAHPTWVITFQSPTKRNPSKLIMCSLQWPTNYNTVVWCPWHLWDFNLWNTQQKAAVPVTFEHKSMLQSCSVNNKYTFLLSWIRCLHDTVNLGSSSNADAENLVSKINLVTQITAAFCSVFHKLKSQRCQ
jgi:hypothetical protein